MLKYIQSKTLKQNVFLGLIEPCNTTNIFSNYGPVVKELENTARDMLKINDDKAVVATSSGTSALAAMIQGIRRTSKNQVRRVCTQDFTFACNSVGPAEGPIVVDIDSSCMIDFEDKYLQEDSEIIILTNCFGHLYDTNLVKEKLKDKAIIYDNAASPYSFVNGENSCNLGTGSFVSLHHTKPMGFGEGGLAIIDKEYEEYTRAAVNFGIINGSFNEFGGNHKMSEISAAAILQWWDQFDIDTLATKYLDNYYNLRYLLREVDGDFWPHYGDENFFPNCLPFVHREPTSIDSYNDREVRKYYKPLRDFPFSSYVYDRISCFSITDGL